MNNKRKGYRVERKIKLMFAKKGWEVVRAGGSFGAYDLIAFKNGKCLFLQIKSTKKNTLYYNGYKKDSFEGFPFFLVVDFGRNNIRVTKPNEKIRIEDGLDIQNFIDKNT